MGLRIRTGDIVEVISGSAKYNPVDQKRGRVRKVYPETARVLVEGLNKIFRHKKPSQGNPKGGRVEIEAPLPVAKVMLVCPACNKPTRVRMRVAEDAKVRVCLKCGKDFPVVAKTGK
ncbi:MAG: 50S ribosomal protein L24 [Planctomycetota bacterium]